MSMIKDLSHLCLSGIFIRNGAQAFLSPGPRVNMVANAGIPQPNLAVELNGALMVIGGVLLALGIAPICFHIELAESPFRTLPLT